MKKGDIVYLNSGSPSLTITEIVGGNATVTWEHDKEGTQLADFPLACLSTTNSKVWEEANA